MVLYPILVSADKNVLGKKLEFLHWAKIKSCRLLSIYIFVLLFRFLLDFAWKCKIAIEIGMFLDKCVTIFFLFIFQKQTIASIPKILLLISLPQSKKQNVKWQELNLVICLSAFRTVMWKDLFIVIKRHLWISLLDLLDKKKSRRNLPFEFTAMKHN